MIDANKYKGFTAGPWTLSEEYAYELFVYAANERIAKIDGNMMNDGNAELIADAPLLLAEVHRLREAMKTMLDDMNNASPEEDIEYWLDTWKHWLKEMIE